MKTLSRNLFALIFAVAVLFSSNSFANGRNDDKNGEGTPAVTTSGKFAYSLYAIKESLKFRLNFENEDGTSVMVKIYDPNGRLAFSETINRQISVRRNYDLSNMGKGIYKVVLTDGDVIATQEIGVGIRTNQGEFNAFLSKDLTQGALKLAYQNGDAEGVNIVLRDEKGNIVYDEVSANEQYARKFNLSKLSKGTYTMSVTSGKKTIEQMYKVQ
jgi:hypothetical protein